MDQAIHIVPLRRMLLELLQGIVHRWFPKPGAFYLRYGPQEYHSLVLQAQNEMNEIRMPQLIVSSIETELKQILNTYVVYHQSNLYLRAARPRLGSEYGRQEVVGWHRESMYGGPEQAWNLWIPVLNVVSDNTLRYIPGSDKLPTDALKIEAGTPDPNVAKGSDGNKIGLLYEPKTITGGVDFGTAQRIELPPDACAVFPGELIHGAAVNDGADIRFSVDLRIIALRYVSGGKQFHAASGREYFVPLEKWNVTLE